VPESYRWLVSSGKIEKAHGVIAKIARINGKPVPDFSKFAEIVKAAESTSKEKKYTIVDIVRNRTQFSLLHHVPFLFYHLIQAIYNFLAQT
jgi:hypothetical protein